MNRFSLHPTNKICTIILFLLFHYCRVRNHNIGCKPESTSNKESKIQTLSIGCEAVSITIEENEKKTLNIDITGIYPIFKSNHQLDTKEIWHM